jgi:hypothetical protein
MANEDMKASEEWRTKDAILSALALLDERGTNRDVSLAMAIVEESFNTAERGESVSSFEILQRARWADSIGLCVASEIPSA